MDFMVDDCMVTTASFGADRWECKRFCSFGITEAIAGVVASGLGGIGLGGALGGALPAVSTGIAGALEGAAGGAALSGITGGKPGIGALTGGLTGGAVAGLGPAIGAGLGGGTAANIAGDVAAGAGAGLAGGALTGQPLGRSALTGAGVGTVAGLGGIGTPSTSATASPSVTPTSASGGVSGAAGAGVPATALGTTGGGPAFIGTVDTSGVGGVPTATPVSGFPTTTSGSAFDTSPAATGGGASGGSFAPGTGTSAPQDFSAGGAGGSFIDRALAQVSANPLSLVAGGGLLLDSFLQKPISQTPEAKPLEASAGRTAALGANLESYLNTGTLPPGAAAAVQNATNAEKASIRSSFAAQGLSDSTPEAQALAQADRNKAAQTFQIGDQLLSQGAQFTNISDQLYQQILQQTLQQDQQFQQALGTFAAGLAGAGLRPSNASTA